MNNESKKRLANLLPDLGDEFNPQYDFSSIGLKPYCGSSFLPYFVVYRFKSSFDDDPTVMEHNPLVMKCFETLFSLYKFVSSNFESWSFYCVGRCLESFTGV